MRVGGAHDRRLEQTVVLVYGHEGLNNEDDETQVVLGCLARTVEQHAGVGGQAPVFVLA